MWKENGENGSWDRMGWFEDERVLAWSSSEEWRLELGKE
jgi:hypothetical protein